MDSKLSPELQPLKIGDVVSAEGEERLMMVESPGEEVTCLWFEGDELRRGQFPRSALTRIGRVR